MFFYDKWVAHDADGNAFKNEFPYVSHLYSQVCILAYRTTADYSKNWKYWGCLR
jgi:hypothetical protein